MTGSELVMSHTNAAVLGLPVHHVLHAESQMWLFKY